MVGFPQNKSFLGGLFESVIGSAATGFGQGLQESISTYFDEQRDRQYRSVIDKELQRVAEQEGRLDPASIARTVMQLPVPERYKNEYLKTAQLISSIEANQSLTQQRDAMAIKAQQAASGGAQRSEQDIQELMSNPDPDQYDKTAYLSVLKKLGADKDELRLAAQEYDREARDRSKFKSELEKPFKDRLKALDRAISSPDTSQSLKRKLASDRKEEEQKLAEASQNWRPIYDSLKPKRQNAQQLQESIAPPQVQAPTAPRTAGSVGGQDTLYNKLINQSVLRAAGG